MIMEPVERIFAEKAEAWSSSILELREMILANLVMTSQIPAKAFEEERRAAFVLDRLIECGASDPYIDDMGNVIGVIPGKNSEKKVLLTAHMDSVFDDNSDHNVSITTDRAEGIGIADNALGLTVLITLPDILKQLDLTFDCDIVLVATAASKEKGDLAGIRHYMDRHHEKIDFNINLEGITLGQVDHNALSRVRCDITCSMNANTANSSWRAIGQNSAILMLSDVLDSLLSIPLPNKPKTVMNIGKIGGGKTYSRICEKASLSLEVRSEDDSITDQVIEDIKDNCRDVGSKYGVELGLNFFSRHHAAGIKHSHPMVKTISSILKQLEVQLKVGLSNSEIAVPLHHGIPSVTIGISTGAEDREGLFKSFVDIDPIPKGIIQLLILIQNIDEGHCDEQR
jgi:acetylornithine deacetylase/succinyl-diaminopimelate desuccinylase-like protein